MATRLFTCSEVMTLLHLTPHSRKPNLNYLQLLLAVENSSDCIYLKGVVRQLISDHMAAAYALKSLSDQLEAAERIAAFKEASAETKATSH